MRTMILATLLCFVASTTHAEIPQPVIDNCNSTVESYDDMPECLKTGYVAYTMLGIALHDSYYGPDAREIANGCWKENGQYYRTWLCFIKAARKAVETRELIGLENMKDKCYVMLSDSDTLENLNDTFEQTKRQLVDGKDFYWSRYHRSFKGCPDHDTISQSEKNLEPRQSEGGHFSEEACLAYSEFDAIVASLSLSQLENLSANLREISAKERLNKWREIGLSEAAHKHLRSAPEKEMGFVLGAIIKKHHPELWDTLVLKGGEKTNITSSNEMGRKFVDKILQKAFSSYEKECHKISQ